MKEGEAGDAEEICSPGFPEPGRFGSRAQDRLIKGRSTAEGPGDKEESLLRAEAEACSSLGGRSQVKGGEWSGRGPQEAAARTPTPWREQRCPGEGQGRSWGLWLPHSLDVHRGKLGRPGGVLNQKRVSQCGGHSQTRRRWAGETR